MDKFDWEDQQFQEWEDREFEDAIASDLTIHDGIYAREQIEFAITEMAVALSNLVRVVNEMEDVYNKMIPSSLHAALMTVMNEIEEWSTDA